MVSGKPPQKRTKGHPLNKTTKHLSTKGGCKLGARRCLPDDPQLALSTLTILHVPCCGDLDSNTRLRHSCVREKGRSGDCKTMSHGSPSARLSAEMVPLGGLYPDPLCAP